ncbi:MAG TPA: AzlD domain-containing protein [Micromonosporaceae bacterium]|jgi:branched-subunit amino acid transport protein
MSTATLILVITVLGAGTYGLRLSGVLLAKRVPASPAPSAGTATVPTQPGRGSQFGQGLTRLLPYAAVALLAALAATAAFTDAGRFAGIARPAGVLAGFVAGLLRAPFAVAVLLAAGVAAALRLLGIH